MSYFADYIVMGRIFIPDGWVNLWDEDLPLPASVQSQISEI